MFTVREQLYMGIVSPLGSIPLRAEFMYFLKSSKLIVTSNLWNRKL